MSSLLARLGRASYRHRGLVTVAWLALLGAVVALLVTVGGSFDDRFTIPGSESQAALDQLDAASPASAGVNAQIVFVAPEGATVTDPAFAGAIQRVVAAAGHAPQVDTVVSPFESSAVSPDGRAALATVDFTVSHEELDPASLDALQDATRAAEDAGLETAVGGNAFGTTGVHIGATEFVGVVVAVLVLVLTFGSLLAAGMNLLTALIGIAVGMGGLLLASNVVTLSSTAPTLALMIGLAVGIDYALFILSRHRTQLGTGMDPEESAARATGTAGSAVVFAGLTVVIALSGLSVVGIPFLTVMGVGAAGTVLVAVAVALTLLPALLGFAGARLAPRPGSRAARRERAEAAADADSHARSAGARWARLVTRRPLVTVVAVLAGLVVLAIPAPQLQLALPDNSSAAPESPQRQAYDLISEHFGAGLNGPLVVLAEGLDPATAQQSVGSIAAAIGGAPPAAPRPVRGGPGDGAPPPPPPPPPRGAGDAHGDARPVRGRPGRRRLRAAHAAARRDDGDRHRDPGERAAGGGDQHARGRPARSGGRSGGPDRCRPRRHRPDGRGDRRLRPPRRRPTALRPRRRRAGAGPAAPGLPVDPGAGEGRRRLPALGRRLVRSRRGGVPVGLAGRCVRSAVDRPGHQLPPGHPHGGAVRPRHGLRGVPGLADA